VISCQRLHAVLRVVLTVGNTLNYGTPRGSADGLRLDSLQKLADMKVGVDFYSLSPLAISKPECLIPTAAPRAAR